MSFSFEGYKILIDQKLDKYIRKNFPVEYREVFNEKLKYLASNPSHPSLNTKNYNISRKALKKMSINEVWEFYINRKEYRCVFYVSHSEEIIIIAYVGNHNQIRNKYK